MKRICTLVGGGKPISWQLAKRSVRTFCLWNQPHLMNSPGELQALPWSPVPVFPCDLCQFSTQQHSASQVYIFSLPRGSHWVDPNLSSILISRRYLQTVTQKHWGVFESKGAFLYSCALLGRSRDPEKSMTTKATPTWWLLDSCLSNTKNKINGWRKVSFRGRRYFITESWKQAELLNMVGRGFLGVGHHWRPWPWN